MANDIEDKLIDFLNQCFPLNSKVIVALSGGVDSVVLLTSLAKLRDDLDIVAAHCNHNLREASKSDAEFCAELCEQLGVTFELANLDVVSFCSEKRVGTEEGARHLRHLFFKELKDLHNTDYLLLGHHANDRAETVFFNFLRGTGLGGMSAMKKADVKRGIYRPLLGFEKADIIEYAKSHNLTWVEDHTNHEVDYDRNWIRNFVFPALSERRSGIVKVMNRTAEQFDLLNDFIELQARNYITEHISINSAGNVSLFDINDFLQQHKALQNAVVMQLWVDLYGSSSMFSNKILKEFDKWIQKDMPNGKSVDFGKDFRLINRNGYLGVKPLNQNNIQEINKNLLSKHSVDECENDGLPIRRSI